MAPDDGGTAQRPRVRPGPPLPRQGENGLFDQCWYPLALSRELAKGKAIGRDFLDGRVVIFRGESGEVAVLSAYCSHLGADLSCGDVIGDSVRCAFHHWHYGLDGRCNNIPSGDAIPRGAYQFKFPSVERVGMIWAFNGVEPLYQFPLEGVSEDTHVIRATKLRDFPIDPGLFMCNTFDFQHFRVVHGLRPENNLDPVGTFEKYKCHYQIRMSPPEGYDLVYDLAIVGTNVFRIVGHADGRAICGMYCATPTPGGNSMNFMVTCTPKPRDEREEALVEAFLDRMTKLRDKIVSEDWPILSAMRYARTSLLTKSDAMLGRFIAYARNYPRANPAREFN
jgi:nitrite reductase/ring-hydroxylating ferredoxin subunit